MSLAGFVACKSAGSIWYISGLSIYTDRRKCHLLLTKENQLAAKKFVKGLDGRQRDNGGAIRRKRGDTKVKTLRLEYGEHFLPEFRANTRLDAVLKKRGVDSLHQLLKSKRV